MNGGLSRCIILCILFFCELTTAQPETVFLPAVGLRNSNPRYYNSTGSTNGWKFTTHENIVVTHLGIFDYAGDGFVQNHEIGIFKSDGTLLVSGLIGPDVECVIREQFRYVGIESVSLLAGESYIIGAYYAWHTPDYFAGGATDATFDPRITFITAMYEYSDGLIIPDLVYPNTNAAPGFFGPTFASIPEPSAILMFGVGTFALRRKRPA